MPFTFNRNVHEFLSGPCIPATPTVLSSSGAKSNGSRDFLMKFHQKVTSICLHFRKAAMNGGSECVSGRRMDDLTFAVTHKTNSPGSERLSPNSVLSLLRTTRRSID